MNVYENLERIGLELPGPTKPGGIYTTVLPFGDKLIYTSGTSGSNDTDPDMSGKLGRELTLEQGQEMARRCALNIISNLHHTIGDLNRIKKFVKLLAFVASDDEFYQQPQVINGASKLLLEIFGEEAGMPARSAIGVNVLPGNIPVEIEAIVELK